ncbi:hypothetical protein [Streptomyces bobili]
MSAASQRPELRFPLIENGLDYLVDVAERLATGPGDLPDARALKYAVLHLQAATELFLKARLQDEHWSLVFRKPETATPAAFESKKFDSCTMEEAFTRLTRIAGLALPAKGLAAVKDLAQDRNALQHYGLTTPAAVVESHAANVLNFLLPFITDHFLPGLDAAQRAAADRALAGVSGRVHRIEAYLKKRTNELRTELKDVAHRTVACPECAQPALVLGGDRPGCRFCLKTWSDPEVTAEEYTWQLYGMDPLLPGVDDAEIRVCPNCEAEALVTAVTAAAPDTASILCFSCATDFTGTAFVLCVGGCARPLPADSADPRCPDCTTAASERM